MKKSLLALVLCAQVFAQDWIRDGQDDNYPVRSYLSGLGVSDRSATAAAQNAMAQVQKQIRSVIYDRTSNELSYSNQSGEKYFQNSIGTQTQISVAGESNGIQIVHQTQKASTYYALAVLDKAHYGEILRLKLQDIADDAQSQKGLAIKALRQGEGVWCFSALGQVYDKLNQAQPLLEDYHVVSISAVSPVDLPAKSEIDSIASAAIQDLSIQKSTTDPDLITMTMGGQALRAFSADLTENGRFVAHLRSNDSGQVRLNGDLLSDQVGVHHLSLEPHWNLPSQLQDQLKNKGLNFDYKVDRPNWNCHLRIQGAGATDAQWLNKWFNWGIVSDVQAVNSIQIQWKLDGNQTIQGYSGTPLPQRFNSELTLSFIQGNNPIGSQSFSKQIIAKDAAEARKKILSDLHLAAIRNQLNELCQPQQ